jgi:hypothetical protein
MSDVTISLEQAFDQIEAFRSIHEPTGVTMEAVLCLQEAVGIDDATRALIRERLYEAEVSRDSTATFLGLIIGLLAAQLDRERVT